MTLVLPKVSLVDNNPEGDWVHSSYDYTPIKDYLTGINGISWEESAPGVFTIIYQQRSYTYWPKSGKWRAKGNKTIYRSRDIEHFLNVYVFK